MDSGFSIASLAEAVNNWCAEHQIAPVSGQAGAQVTERNIRYYRTLGLVDAPLSGAGKSFSKKHYLQLVAVRLLQAQGVPLRRIRELLYGRSLDELGKIEKRGLVEAKQSQSQTRFIPKGEELWRAIPLNENYLLVSRRGTPITEEQKEALVSILHPRAAAAKRQASPQRAHHK